MRSQILITTFFLFFLAWQAKSKKGCKDPTFFDSEFYKKFKGEYNSFEIDPDPSIEHDQSLCDPKSIRRRGAVSERCGTDYLADLEKVGADYKPIADKSKWTVPENNPFYYARMCHPGERCVIGYYKNESFPPGRSETMKASAGKCVACEGNGEYTDGSLKNPAKCSQCPIGQFTREKYAKSCTKCPKGSSTPAEGSTECVICDAGRYSPQAGSACLKCPNGKFNNATNSNSCEDCPPGRWSHEGGGAMTECKPCRAGHASKESGYDGTKFKQTSKYLYGCPACTAGRFASGIGESECKPCERGRFSVHATGSKSCAACGKGQFSNILGNKNRNCEYCASGRFADVPGLAECKPCGAGSVSSAGSGSHSCKKCLAGRFSGSETSSKCEPCGAGTFADAAGAKECKPCGKGYVSAHSEASASCDACDKGKFSSSPTSDKCEACTGGRYSDAKASSECKACGAGRISVSKLSSQYCTECFAGQYSSSETSTECTHCKPGTYARGKSNKECKECETGRFQSVRGIDAGQADCEDCPHGTFNDKKGLVYDKQFNKHPCFVCKAGEYAAGTGNEKCKACGKGSRSSQKEHSHHCVPCEAGKFSASETSSECFECDKGQFSDEEKSSECKACAKGGTSVSCGTLSTPTSTAVTRATINWKQMKGVDCVSTMMSLLRIGEEMDGEGKHKAFDTWSVGKCQAKCAKNPACKGFNYDNDLGVCRYKKSLSHAKTIQRSTHDCWVYDPAGIPITIGKGTTATRPTTTPAAATTYTWLINPQKECSSAQSRGLHIGDNFIRDDFRQDFDVASVAKCLRKCAQYVNCDGFNYEFGKGICRYKQGITTSSGRSSSTFDCYVYLKPTTTPTPQATQPPSTPRTPTKASIVTTAPSSTPKSIANRPSQRPTSSSTLRQNIDSVQGNTTPKSGGTIAGAVVGTILGVAGLAGAIVAVMLFFEGEETRGRGQRNDP